MLLKDLASFVGGALVGDGFLKIKRFSAIENAKEGDLVFVLSYKYLADALNSKASALIVSGGVKIGKKNAILVDNPRLAMAKILKHFAKKPEIEPGIHKFAFVHKSAKIGANVSIGPFSYIGQNVKIGDSSIIYPNVTIYSDVTIGKRCIIHAGARIGMDGFGFVKTAEIFEKIPQIGGVLIGDDVEIYSNTCIARGTLGNTVIGSGTKIDNLSHVAHNCRIGENCAIVSLVGFAGSVTLEDHVSVGGQAGFAGHLTVGENTVIMSRAGVTKDVPSNSVVSGFPAIDHQKELQIQAAVRRLSRGK